MLYYLIILGPYKHEDMTVSTNLDGKCLVEALKSQIELEQAESPLSPENPFDAFDAFDGLIICLTPPLRGP